jgi:hypothetical protein
MAYGGVYPDFLIALQEDILRLEKGPVNWTSRNKADAAEIGLCHQSSQSCDSMLKSGSPAVLVSLTTTTTFYSFSPHVPLILFHLLVSPVVYPSIGNTSVHFDRFVLTLSILGSILDYGGAAAGMEVKDSRALAVM